MFTKRTERIVLVKTQLCRRYTFLKHTCCIHIGARHYMTPIFYEISPLWLSVPHIFVYMCKYI